MANVTENSLPSQAIFNSLVALHHLEPLPNWSLDHRLFRESGLGATQSATGYLQLLTLSHHDGNSYIGISKAEKGGADASTGPATIVAVPTGSGSEEFSQLMVSRFAPLWQRRQMTVVNNGQAYEVGAFVIRFGEIREAKQGQGGVQQVRGTIIEVECSGDGGNKMEESIQEFWGELGFPEAKGFFSKFAQDDGFGHVRRWLEAMRLRA